MSKRAVNYARVSYDDRGNDARNLQGQLEMGREHAHKHGYIIVEEISEDDRGAKGAELDLPGLNRVLEMAQAGEFDILIVRELDRLARRLAKQLLVEEELRRAGVEIEYVLGNYDDTPEGNLMKNVRAVVAEYEALKIAERMKRARRLKVKAGSVMVHGRPPYGYELVEKDNKRMLEVFEPEARVVRMVFRWYTEGDGENGPVGTDTITRKLIEMRVPTYVDAGTRSRGIVKKKGYGEWCQSVVYHILTNETYAGTWHYGKRVWKNGRRVRGSDDYLIAVEVPPIISREMWEAALAQRVQNKQNARRNTKYDYLLSKRVICGRCGHKMAGESRLHGEKLYQYYRCTARGLRIAHRCNAPHFRVDQVDATVWEWVKSFLADPVALKAGLERHQAERKQENVPLQERLAVVDDLLADNRAQLERLLDLYLSGDFPREMLTDRKTRLEAIIAALEKEWASLNATLEAQTLTQEQIQTIQDFAVEVARGLKAADQDFATRRRVIELLDVCVRLAIEDGEKVVYIECILDEGVLCVVPSTTRIHGHNTQKPFVLTARLVLPKPTRGKRAG